MNSALRKIVLERGFLDINTKLLRSYTKRLTDEEVAALQWDKVEHLHIVGTDGPVSFAKLQEILPGYYVDEEGVWVLAVHPTVEEVEKNTFLLWR